MRTHSEKMDRYNHGINFLHIDPLGKLRKEKFSPFAVVLFIKIHSALRAALGTRAELHFAARVKPAYTLARATFI